MVVQRAPRSGYIEPPKGVHRSIKCIFEINICFQNKLYNLLTPPLASYCLQVTGRLGLLYQLGPYTSSDPRPTRTLPTRDTMPDQLGPYTNSDAIII